MDTQNVGSFERNTLLATKKSKNLECLPLNFQTWKLPSAINRGVIGQFVEGFPATKNPSKSWPSVDQTSRFELFTAGLPRPRGRGSQQELGEYQRRLRQVGLTTFGTSLRGGS